MTPAALVLGVIDGMIVGLLAVGMVLVFRSSRFLNLAHAQLGAVPALLLAKMVLDWGWSWAIAFPICVVIGAASAALVDRLFVRRLRARTSSSVSMLLLTVGVTQLLLAVTYIPAFGPDGTRLASRGYPLPFRGHLRVAGITLGSQHVLIVVMAPLLVLALAAFLHMTFTGKSIRAAASNPTAARLCGISTDRVSLVAWSIAGGLSAMTAVLQAPSLGSTSGASLGPYLLLLALGAAAFGGFVSIPGALAGGVVMGVAEQVTLSVTSNVGDAEMVVFATTLAAIILRGRRIGEAFESGTGAPAVQDRPPLRVPRPIADRAVVTHRSLMLRGYAVGVAVLLPLLPVFRSQGNRFELTLVALYAVLGVSLTILIGWAGQISLGHFAVVGVGAFVAARLVPHGWSLPATVALAGLAGALAMTVIGLPALRIPGLALAVPTLGLAVVAPDWLFHQHWFGSSQPFGIEVPIVPVGAGLGRLRSPLDVYYAAVVVLAVTVVTVGALRHRSPARLALAVRDNEPATAAFGLTPATIKLSVLALSGFLAATAGVVWAASWGTVAADQFPPQLSLSVLAVPVIGGLGSVPGAVAGAIFVYMPALFLGPHLTVVFGSLGRDVGFQLALGGWSTVMFLLRFPTGLAGAAQARWETFLERIASGQAHSSVAGYGGETGAAGPALVADDVRLAFGGIAALDGASIRVARGEIVGLIGPNGAGKTTLLNVISGSLRPGHGSIALGGVDVTGLPPDQRAAFGLGRTFQDARLFPGLTVKETVQVSMVSAHRVGFLSAAVGAPWALDDERRSDTDALAILRRLGLDGYADSLMSQLSTGTRRICSLAAQVGAKPSMLLLDEPTGGVAQREAEAFGPLIRRVRSELDCSVLIVEHDMPLLMGVCDRIYAMESGRVIAEGTPDQIRSDPNVIASYLGTRDAAVGRSGAAPPPAPAAGRWPASQNPW